MSVTPNMGIPYVPEGTLDPAAGLNLSLNVIDALLQTAVISMDLYEPPVTGSDGDLYIVGDGASGAWAGQDRNLARYVLEGGSWQFYEAGVEIHYVINLEDGGLYKFIDDSPGANWTLAAGLSDAPVDGNPYGRRDGAWEQIPDITALAAATVLTVDDETADYPNSRRHMPGMGLIFDDLTANIRTIRIPQANKRWQAVDAAAIAGIGCTTPTVVGTASSPALATGGTIGGYMIKRRQTSTTAANNVASFRCSVAADGCYAGATGSSATQAAGLYIRLRCGINVSVAGMRFFAGLALNAAEAGTVDPSALLNCFGIAKDGADTNYQLIHNDGSGAATKVDLGLAAASNKYFDIELYVRPGGGTWDYRIQDMDTGTFYTGSVSSNIPANDTELFWRIWGSVGASAGTAIVVDCHSVEQRYPL